MASKTIKIAIIGLGGMGTRWAQVVREHAASRILGVTDADVTKTAEKAAAFECKTYTDWREAVADPEADAVVIATPHVFLAPIAKGALEHGKHVFCEKPGGISLREIEECAALAIKKNVRWRANYNMRLHPALALAKQKLSAGEIGKSLFLRGVYSHGGREGYDKEWWLRKELSGGGALIGQGCHLVDIAFWFLGGFSSVSARLENLFWKGSPADDNAFLLLRTDEGRVASLHTSWTHWKKMFRVELYGDEGYLVMEGLGGQYGLERLTQGKRVFGKEAPPEEVFEFPSETGKPDAALKNSWNEFVQSVQEGRYVGQAPGDALETMRIMEAAMASSERNTVEQL